MDKVTLGRTGLEVTRMGLGCGGPSRVGQSTGRSKAESVAVVREALDAGVNFIDTAEAYHTEEIVGEAIRGLDRSSLVLSTKKRSRWPITPQDVRDSLEASLRRLGTDYVDVYHLPGVVLADYCHLLSEVVPEMQRLRESDHLLAVSDENAKLHRRLLDISGHVTAARLIGALNSQMVRFQYRTILLPGRSERSFAEHAELIAAIASRDGERAEAAMRAHLSSVADALRRQAPE